jgi:ribosomal protein L37AE/L43A
MSEPHRFRGNESDQEHQKVTNEWVALRTGQHRCQLCGWDVSRYEATLGSTRIWNCRNCGMTSYEKTN